MTLAIRTRQRTKYLLSKTPQTVRVSPLKGIARLVMQHSVDKWGSVVVEKINASAAL